MKFEELVKQYIELLEQDKKAAEDYYKSVLFDEVCNKFSQKVKNLINENKLKKYRYLILSVGHSPEPLIMWIKALDPLMVFMLCSNETKKYIDYIVKKTGLSPTQYKFEEVNSSKATDVYEQIKEFIEKNNLLEKLEQIAVDISGGKKSMVGGCTLAASYLNIDTLYVDNEKYLDKYRKPYPGTETPVKLDDPLNVFGDLEYKLGVTKFNSRDFAGAKEVFSKIKERVAKPKPYEMSEALSDAYQALEAMEFARAITMIDKVINIAETYNIKNLPKQELKNQRDVLEPLKEIKNLNGKQILEDSKFFWHMLGYTISIAGHYYFQKKADLSALLIYRCLEMLTQYLLYKQGIYASEADYRHLNQSELLQKVNEIAGKLYPKFKPIQSLPEKVGLMDGLVILQALNEPIISKISLNEILKFTDLRNKSRFAHGYTVLSADDVKSFYYRVLRICENVWKKEKDQLNYTWRFETFVKKFDFIKLS